MRPWIQTIPITDLNLWFLCTLGYSSCSSGFVNIQRKKLFARRGSCSWSVRLGKRSVKNYPWKKGVQQIAKKVCIFHVFNIVFFSALKELRFKK